MKIINEVQFSDLDARFEAHPVTGDVPILRQVEAIRRSIRNLVLSSRFDTPYNPSVHGGVLAALFENFDPTLVLELQDRVKTVLQFEPRAENVVVRVVDVNRNLDKNGISIEVEFTPVNYNSRVSVNIFLERLR